MIKTCLARTRGRAVWRHLLPQQMQHLVGSLPLANNVYCISSAPQSTEEANRFLVRNFIKMGHNINVTISPLIAALYKGQEDVVRLLVEAGAEVHTELNHWCDQAIIDEPRLEPVLRKMMSIAMLYDDFKAYGPFGFHGYQVNSADAGNIPREGTIHAIIVQFSLLDGNAITALQFVHMVNGQPFPCKIHHTNEAHAGNFDALNNFSHVERLTLEDNEYVISAELGVGDRFITSIRFTVRLHDATHLHPQGTLLLLGDT
jgi:hypothetical protein